MLVWFVAICNNDSSVIESSTKMSMAVCAFVKAMQLLCSRGMKPTLFCNDLANDLLPRNTGFVLVDGVDRTSTLLEVSHNAGITCEHASTSLAQYLLVAGMLLLLLASSPA